MAFATINDVKEYEPNIDDYGIQSFDLELSKAQQDVERYLRIHWWPSQQVGRFDLALLVSMLKWMPINSQNRN